MSALAGLKAVLSVGLLASLGWMGVAAVTGGRGIEARPPVLLSAPPQTVQDRLVVPVLGVRREDLVDTWGHSREGGRRAHEAIDIMAPRGTPVLAAAPGSVEKLFVSVRGGNTVYLRSPDRGTIYYYAHLDRYAQGLAERRSVRAGQVIGYVGSTGDAAPNAPHLHFAINRARSDEGWWQGRAINPYPLLRY